MEDVAERAREVLKEIVRLHAETGRPVSSRALSKLPKFHSSAATLRNHMVDLADAGYLSQPHTSAGRVPTEKGYRYYVRSLMQPTQITSGEREIVSDGLSDAGNDPARLFPAVSRMLSRLSGEVGVVLAPDERHSIIREIRFVSVTREKALAIQIGEGDAVSTRLVETAGRFSDSDLERAGNYLTAEFGGATLASIRDRLARAMRDERERLSGMLLEAIDLARGALGPQPEAGVYTEGTQHLLGRPEFARPEAMRKVYRAFEEKAELVDLLDQCLGTPGPRIVLGSESHLTTENPLSAVLVAYGTAKRPRGALGIVGSVRMPYPKIVPLVEFLGKAVSARLAQGEEKAEEEDGGQKRS
jgi:heat-inducible transcriptional repressor